MSLFKLNLPTCWACATALALCGVSPMATAQGVPASASASPTTQATVNTPLNTPLQTSGKAVSARVSEPANEALTTAASPTSTPALESNSAAASSAASAPGAPVTEAATEVPAAPASTSAAAEAPQSTELERVQEILEPILSNPLTGAGALLALMLVFAVLVYRRNQRAVDLMPSSLKGKDDAPKEEPAHPEPMDPLLLPRGLQADIMALDLELGSSEGPSSTSVAPMRPALAPPSGKDLSLSKLQWAQQLLAAGENELARVLLTSVAESLHSQLRQREASSQGPRE